MKRKIALALAAVMTIVSVIPMNLFAATTTTTSIVANSNYDYNGWQGMFSPGGNQSLASDTIVSPELSGLFNDGRGFQNNSLINSAKGTNLIVRFNDYSTEGSFQVELDGANFGYAYAPQGAGPDTDTDSIDGVYMNDANGYETTFGDWFQHNYESLNPHLVNNLTTGAFGINLGMANRQDVALKLLEAAATTLTDVVLTAPIGVAAGTYAGNPALPTTTTVNAILALTASTTDTATDFYKAIADAVVNDVANANLQIIENTPNPVTANVGNTYSGSANSVALTKAQLVNGIVAYLQTLDPAVDTVNSVATAVWNAYTTVIDPLVLATNKATDLTTAEEKAVVNFVNVAKAMGLTDIAELVTRLNDEENTNIGTYNQEAKVIAQQSNFVSTSTAVEYEMVVDNTNRSLAQVHYKGAVTPYDFLVITLPYNNRTGNAVTAKIVSRGGNSNVTDASVVVASGSGTGVTVTTDASAKGNYRIYLNDLRFEEKTIGTIQNGEVTFRAKVKDRSQYYFPAAYNNRDTVSVTSFIGITGEARVTDVIVREREGTITLKIAGMTPSVGTLGTLVVKGLVVAPINPEDAPYGGEIKLEILPNNEITYKDQFDDDREKKFVNTVKLPKRLEGDSFVVAKRDIWEVGIKVENVKEIFAGRTYREVGQIILEENTENSYWSAKESTFTLTNAEGEAVEGAKISKVEIKTSNMTPDYDNKGFDSDQGNKSNVIWSKDLSAVTLVDFVPTKAKTGTMKVKFWVSIDPNFPELEGTDLYVTVNKGRDLFTQSNVEAENIVKVATVFPTTEIEVGETKVQIGYQSLSVANITLTETKKGAWEKGNVQLAIGEYGTGEVSPYMYFGAVAKGNVEVANPDKTQLMISNVKSGGKDRLLSFSVDRKSDYIGTAKKSDPAEISLKDIVLNISREVPEGSFDLIVGGSALVGNYTTDLAELKKDRFEAFGYVAEGAIQVTTVGSNKPFTKRVDVYYAEGAPAEGGSKVVVDGVETDMEFGAYLDTEVNRVMVPVRFISYVLGVEEENTFWNAKDGTFSIFTPERTVVFKQNSNILTVNGLTSTMMNADGTEITPIIRADNQKLYLPFAFVGQAFGIGVNSDNQADGFVSYNYDTTTEVVAE